MCLASYYRYWESWCLGRLVIDTVVVVTMDWLLAANHVLFL